MISGILIITMATTTKKPILTTTRCGNGELDFDECKAQVLINLTSTAEHKD